MIKLGMGCDNRLLCSCRRGTFGVDLCYLQFWLVQIRNTWCHLLCSCGRRAFGVDLISFAVLARADEDRLVS